MGDARGGWAEEAEGVERGRIEEKCETYEKRFEEGRDCSECAEMRD